MALATRIAAHRFIVPETPPVALAVGENFERFTPTAPALSQPAQGQAGLTGSPNRPGQGEYDGPLVYAKGSSGLTNTLGGEPLLSTSDRIHRPPGAYTLAKAPTIKLRKGVGQKGPSELGVAQTVAQATRTAHPPAGTPLLQMLAGQG